LLFRLRKKMQASLTTNFEMNFDTLETFVKERSNKTQQTM